MSEQRILLLEDDVKIESQEELQYLGIENGSCDMSINKEEIPDIIDFLKREHSRWLKSTKEEEK